MPRTNRRGFLATASGGVVASVQVARPSDAAHAAGAAQDFPSTPFALGVASGDATPSAIVLWTRLVVKPTTIGYGMEGQPNPLVVHWRIATSEADLESDSACVDFGDFDAVRAHARAVHVDVDGLTPGTTYYYRFFCKGWSSPIGRTRTAPATDKAEPVRFAVADCQSVPGGFYNGYGHLKIRNDIDFVVQLGDYIYEGGAAPHIPAEPCTGLRDYRLRHGQYKLRSSLQETHRRFPFYAAPDDHEFWNNVHGAEVPAGSIDRFNDAMLAYWEHMPLRGGPPRRIDGKRTFAFHRDIRWGSLLNLLLLDTRQMRTSPGTTADHTIVGQQQRDWLTERINGSTTTWTGIGSQVLLSYLELPGDEPDKWRGYPADRKAVTDALAARLADGQGFNPVVLSGDLHCPMVSTVRPNASNSEPVATEFLIPAMSSGAGKDYSGTQAENDNKHPGALDWVGLAGPNRPWRGYVDCHVTETHWDTTYWCGTENANPRGKVHAEATWRVTPGTIGAERRAPR